MNNPPQPAEPAAAVLSGAALAAAGRGARALKSFAFLALALALCFCLPLSALVRYSTHSELYSHVLLMPFIAGYLIWVMRPSLPAFAPGSPRGALIPLLAGAVLLLSYAIPRWRGWQPELDDYLALTVASFLFFLLAAGLATLGSKWIRATAFPLAMLAFMIPFPTMATDAIEFFFQHTSADVTSILLSLSQTPYYRQDLVFDLPGISIRVAPECSGIRSSLVLFITSLLAGYLFLRSPWKRAVLTLFVIPLAMVRNGFRIFTISMLCVHIDPKMIDSPIHRKGGPVFFLLSLFPFFLVLAWLRKSESRKGQTKAAADAPTT